MTSNESWRRYLDAGALVGQVTLARAEEIAKGLLAPDQEEHDQAWRDLDFLGRTGRQIGGQLIDLARREVGRQAKTIGSFEDLVDLIADVVGSPSRAPVREAETVLPESARPIEDADHPANGPRDRPLTTDEAEGTAPPEWKKAKSTQVPKVKGKVKGKGKGKKKKDKKKQQDKKRQDKPGKKDPSKLQRAERFVGPGESTVLTLAKAFDLPGRS